MPSSSVSSATDVEAACSAESDALPQISALYLVRFDQKVGYTIAWKRVAGDDVPLDGVEYKSLPSGLHAVPNDLVYFVHDSYAGLSAFANAPADEAHRNASFVTVGILVPLSYGRLGRSWLHAPRLQKIAKSLAEGSVDATGPLEEFWSEQSSGHGKGKAPTSSSGQNGKKKQQQQQTHNGAGSKNGVKGHSRSRALSTLTNVIPTDQSLPDFHPALAILRYVEVFGPIVFRLQQVALLRKRVLFVGSPPVRDMCEYVYNLSLLATIPSSVSELLSPETDALFRLRTLFSVGIHDIPTLESHHPPQSTNEPEESIELPSQGWAACTTDEIIATKPQLYDILVEIPHAYDVLPSKRTYPSIKTSDGHTLRASQRDVQRYKLLQYELSKYRHFSSSSDASDADMDDDQIALLSRSRSNMAEKDDEVGSFGDEVVEPMTWSRLAYLGFMWWASAGERDAYVTAERDRDRELLGDLSDFSSTGLHTALIAYFHRSTASLVTSLAGLIEASDDEADDDEEGEGDARELSIGRDDLSRIGLDTWSEADRAFLQEFLWCFFGRRVRVLGAELDCCGVRIPVF